MMDFGDLLRETAERSSRYLKSLEERRVFPSQQAIEKLKLFDIALPAHGLSSQEVLARLDELGSDATVASAGPRYYGFVVGGSLPAALAANWLAGAWDQNAFTPLASPAGVYLERIALGWLRELFELPAESNGAFVSGATMANFCGIMAARHALLEKQGWDVEAKGLFGAPEIRVIVGNEAHSSLIKALGMAGLGRERLSRAKTDSQGRILPEELPKLDETTLLCIQAGNVNSGAFDPALELCAAANEAGAWVHVDGAFGLWAAVSPKYKPLMEGFNQADSWACDAHKWLNVPYDCGFVFVRQAEHLGGAFSQRAAYLKRLEEEEPYDFTPESSRRARGVEVWAALLSLGSKGLAAMIEDNCTQAQRMAAGLKRAGISVLNEVVLNQVVVSFGSQTRTKRIITALQQEGTFWAGGTTWRGQDALRISFSSWRTTLDDVDRSLDVILRLNAAEEQA